MKQLLVIPSVLLALACSSPARAQGPQSPTPPPSAMGPRVAQAPGATPANMGKRKRIEKRIRALRVWRLTEALNLDEKTATRLFPILHRFDRQFSKLMRANAKDRRGLRPLMRATGTDAQIKAAINRMLKRQAQMWTLTKQRFAAMRKVLSAKQSAKLLIVLPQIDRQIRGEIRKAMRKHRRQRRQRMRRRMQRRRGGGAYQDPF